MKDKLSSVAPGLSEMMNVSSFDVPIKQHYESLSEEDKQKYADIPAILEKPFNERTEEEHMKCMSMTGFSTSHGAGAAEPAPAPAAKSSSKPKAKPNKKK
jgi:hypothetical protein